MIYPEQRGDCYSKSWSAAEFDHQFEILMDDKAFIAVTDEGFVRLNLIEKIMEMIKGFLGGTNYSQQHRIQAVWLKFLYYGEAHGFLKEKQIERLRIRINYPYERLDVAIDRLFKEVNDYHQYYQESKSDHLSDLRDIVTDYHRRHTASLRPGFWTRIFTPASSLIDSKTLFLFGDAPLQLSEKALVKQANPDLAFAYLQRAFDLKNDSPEFQEQLAKQLQELEASELQGQQRKIQELWIKLGKTAFKNRLPQLAITHLESALQADPTNAKARLQVGKLYLDNQEYSSAQPLLAELQKAFPQDLQMQIEIGHAYWQLNQVTEALDAYETALSCYQNQPEKLSSHQKQMGSVYHHLGRAHLKKLVPNSIAAKAIDFLSLAVKADSIASDYQEDLYEAYVQQWQASPANFAAAYGEEWLKFLSLAYNLVDYKWKPQIIQISMECSEQYFKAHLNQKAHACLDNLVHLFKEDDDIKIQALDVAVRHGDWSPIKSKLHEWESKYTPNPYLKQKIGDAYWSSDQNQAIVFYQQSLDLFAGRVSISKAFDLTDAAHKDCQQRMAAMQARIGQTHLQVKPGLFKGVPYDEAIKNLEQAASIDPDHYASSLFDACLAAAQAEQQRSSLFRDTNKIIAYYLKAFQTLHQEGDYLIELLQLCLDTKRYDDAISIYYDIHKESWAEDFELPAVMCSELASKLFERKEYEATLDCLVRAYELEPQNQKYKQDYFQLNLTLAQDTFQKLQKSKAKDKEKETSQRLLEIAEDLEACWDEGFDKVEKLEKSYQEMLVEIYRSLADCYIQRYLLPKPKKKMEKEAIKQHQTQHEAEIQQALDYYIKALNYQPENAALHFDKGILLDWVADYDEALQEFKLAVKYQPRNPFYQKMLGSFYFIVHGGMEKLEEHEQFAQTYASPDFDQDYRTWEVECMSQVKTKLIDPHAYTQAKKGFFG